MSYTEIHGDYIFIYKDDIRSHDHIFEEMIAPLVNEWRAKAMQGPRMLFYDRDTIDEINKKGREIIYEGYQRHYQEN